MSGPIEISRDAWGDDMPDWVAVLAKECEVASQNKVAARLNRSAALISNVLRRKYPFDEEAIEDRVRGVFMAKVVDCPALGNLPANECRDWRLKSRVFANVNTRRILMYRACNRCHFNGKGGQDEA